MNRKPILDRTGSLLQTLVLGMASLALSAAAESRAATLTWIGGTGTWTATDGTVWSGGGGNPPQAGDTINLTQSGGPFTITYLAGVDATSPVFGPLNLNNSTGVTTFSVGGNGGAADQETLLTGNFFVGNGGRLELSAGGKIGPGPQFASFYVEGGGFVEHTGGTLTTNAGDLTLRPGIGTTAQYEVNGAGAVLTPRHVVIGRQQHGGDVQGTSIFNMIDGSASHSTTIVGNNAGGPAALNVSGGTWSGSSMTVNNTGSVSLSGGQISQGNLFVNGAFHHSGGTNATSFGLNVAGDPGTTGVYTMDSGTITARDLNLGSRWPGFGAVVLGGAGTFIHNGGSITVNGSTPSGLHISHADATQQSTYIFRGATISGNQRMTVETLGTFQGWGTVGLTGAFANHGRIVADGEGIDRTLNLTSLGALSTAENTSDKGWYATGGGKLTLRAVPATAVTNWGEQAGKTEINMVNSAQLAFSGLVGSGSLEGSLLAIDRGDVPLSPQYSLISVYEFELTGPVAFSEFDLTIRFEDILPSGLNDVPGLLHYNGSEWINVISGIDYDNYLIHASGLTSLGLFAVGTMHVPEPSTLALLGLAGIPLVLRRRRRGACGKRE